MTPDVNVIIMDLPLPSKETVVPNEDGSYTIFINAKLSAEQRLKSYEHAIKHIEENDFSKTDVQTIECSAHNFVVSENIEKIPGDKFKNELLRIRKRRKEIQKKMKQHEQDIKFISDIDSECITRTEENRWLYG